jgi:muramidase (phage lysozyme)
MQGDYQGTVFINSQQLGLATKEYLETAKPDSLTATLYNSPSDNQLLRNAGKVILNFGHLKSSVNLTQQTNFNKTLDTYNKLIDKGVDVSLYSSPDSIKRLHIKSYTTTHNKTASAFISTSNLSKTSFFNTPESADLRKSQYQVNNSLFQLNIAFRSTDFNIVNNISKIQSNLFNNRAVNSEGNLLIGGDATLAAINSILSAKNNEEVILSSPYIDDPKVVASLIKAKRSGVNVSVISSNPFTNIAPATGGSAGHDTALELLAASGVHVYTPGKDDPLLIHTKALSVGDKSFIGSHNFTVAAAKERSVDLLALIKDKEFNKQLYGELKGYINKYGLQNYQASSKKQISNIELNSLLKGTSDLYKVGYEVRSPLNPNVPDNKNNNIDATLPYYPTKLSSDFFDYFIGYDLPSVSIYSDLYTARAGKPAPRAIRQLDKELGDPGIGNSINRLVGNKIYSEGLGVGGSFLGVIGKSADWLLGFTESDDKPKRVTIKKLLGNQIQQDNEKQGPFEAFLTNTYAVAAGAAQSVAFYVGVDLPFKYLKSKLEQDQINSLIQYHPDGKGFVNNFKAGASRQVRKITFGAELGSIITDLINEPKTTRANYTERFYERIYDPKNVQKDLLRIARTQDGKLTTIDFGDGYNLYAFSTGMRRFDHARYQKLITPILETINPYKMGSIRYNEFNKQIHELGDILKQEPVIKFEPALDNADILEPVVKNMGQERLMQLSKKYDDIAALLPANILYWAPPIRRVLNLPEFSPETNLTIRDLASFEDAVKWTDHFYKTTTNLIKNPAKNITALASAWKNEINIIQLERQARQAINVRDLPNLPTGFKGTEDEILDLLKTENKVYSQQIDDVQKILKDGRVVRYQNAIKQQNLLIQNSPFKSFDNIFTPSINPFKDPNSPQGLNLQRIRSNLLKVGLFLVADQLADKLIFQNLGANLLTQVAAHKELNTEDGQVARFQFTGVLPKETVIATQAVAGIAAGFLFTKSVDVGVSGDVLLNSIDHVTDFKEQVLSARTLISSNATEPIKKTATIKLLQDVGEASYSRLINLRQDLGAIANRRVKLKFNSTAALAAAFIAGIAVRGLATAGAGLLNFFNNKERGIELDSTDAIMSSTLESLLTKGQSTAQSREDYANLALGHVIAQQHVKQKKTGGRVYSFASQVTTPFFQIPLVMKSDVATGRTSVSVGIQLMPLSGIGITPTLPFSFLLKTPQENPYITYYKLLNQYKPNALSFMDRVKWGAYDTVSTLTGGQFIAYEKESAYEKGFEYIGLSSALLIGAKSLNSDWFDNIDPNFKHLRKAAGAALELPNKALRFIYSMPFMLASSTFKGVNTYISNRVGKSLTIPKQVRKLAPYYLSIAMARMMSDPFSEYVGEDYRDPSKQLDATLNTGLLIGYALDKTGVFASSQELADDFYSVMESTKYKGLTDYKNIFSEWLPSFDNKHYQVDADELIKEVINVKPKPTKSGRLHFSKSLLAEMAAESIWSDAIINRDNKLLIKPDGKPRLIGTKQGQHYGSLPGISLKSMGARIAIAAITIGAIKGLAFTVANMLPSTALKNAYELPVIGSTFRLLAGVEPKTDYLTGIKLDGVKDSVQPNKLTGIISKGIDTLTFGLFGLSKSSGLYSDTPDPFLSLVGQYGLTFKSERVGSYLQFQSSLSDLSLSGYSFLRGKTSKDLLAKTLQLLKMGRAKDINQAIAYIRGATPRSKAAKYENITPYELDAVGSSSGISRAIQIRNYLIQHQAAQRPSELLIDFLKESFALGKISDEAIPSTRLPKTNYSPFGFINHATFIVKKQLFGAENPNKTLDPENSFVNWLEYTNTKSRGIVDPFSTWNAFSELSSKHLKNASWLYLPLFLFTTTSLLITGGELVGRLAMSESKNELAELIKQSKINQGKPISHGSRYTFTLGELPNKKSAVFQVDTHNRGQGVFRLPFDIDEISQREKILSKDLVFGINKQYGNLHKGLHSYLINQYTSDLSDLLKSISDNPAEFNKLKVKFKQSSSASLRGIVESGFSTNLTSGSKATLFSSMLGSSTINHNVALRNFLDETQDLINLSLDDVLISLDNMHSKGLKNDDIYKGILKLNVDLENSESFKQLITRLQQPINGNYNTRYDGSGSSNTNNGTIQKSKIKQVTVNAAQQLNKTWAEGAVSTSLKATKSAFTLLGNWVAQGKTVYELSEAASVLLNGNRENRYKRNVAAKQFVDGSLEYVTAIGISKVLDKLGVTGFKGLAASLVLLIGLDKLKQNSAPIRRIEKAVVGGLSELLAQPVETIGRVFDHIKLGAPIRAVGNLVGTPLNFITSVVSAPFRYVFENILGGVISSQYLSMNKDSMPMQYLKGFLLPRSIYADFSGAEGRVTAFGGREPWLTGNVGILLRQKQLERIASTISADTMISPDMVYGELLGQPTGYAQRSFYGRYMDSSVGTRALTAFGLQNNRISNSLRLAISRRQAMYNQFVIAAPLGRPDEVPDTRAVSAIAASTNTLLKLQLDDLSSSIYTKLINEPGKYSNYVWSVINSGQFNKLTRGIINDPGNVGELFKRFTTHAKRQYVTRFNNRSVTPIIKSISLPINGFGVIRQVSNLFKRIPVGVFTAIGLTNLNISTAIADDTQLKSLDSSNTFKEYQAAYRNTATGLAGMAIGGILSTFIKSPLLVLLGSVLGGTVVGDYIGDSQARDDYKKQRTSWNYLNQTLITGTLLNVTSLSQLIKTYKTAGLAGLGKKVLTNYGLSAITSLFGGPSTSLAVGSTVNELYERVLSKPKLITQSIQNVIKYSKEVPSFIRYALTGKESLSIRRAGRESANSLLNLMLQEVGGQPASLSGIGMKFKGDRFSFSGMFSKYEKSITLSKATQSILGRAKLNRPISQQLLNKARFTGLHEAAHAVEMTMGLSRLGIDDVSAIARQAGVSPEDAKQLIEVLSKQSTLRAARTGYSKDIINSIYLDEISANVRALKLFNKRDPKQVASLLTGLTNDVSLLGGDSVNKSFERLLDNAEDIASQADGGVRYRNKAPLKQLLKDAYKSTVSNIKGLFAPVNITTGSVNKPKAGLLQRLTQGIDNREIKEALKYFTTNSGLIEGVMPGASGASLSKGVGGYLLVDTLFNYIEVLTKNVAREVYHKGKVLLTPAYKYGKEVNTRLGKLGLSLGTVLDTVFTVIDLDVSNKVIDSFKSVNKNIKKLTKTQAVEQLAAGRNLETTNFLQTSSGLLASFISNKMIYGILTSAAVTAFSYFQLGGHFKSQAEKDYAYALQGHAVYTSIQSSGAYLRMHHTLGAETSAVNELLKPIRSLIKTGVSKAANFLAKGVGKVFKTIVFTPLKVISSVTTAVLTGGLPALAGLAAYAGKNVAGVIGGLGALAIEAVDNKIYQTSKKLAPIIDKISSGINFKYQQLTNIPEYLRYQYKLWSTTTESGVKFTKFVNKAKSLISLKTSGFIKGLIKDVGAGLSLLKDDLITAVKQPFKWGMYLGEAAIDLIPRAVKNVGKNIIGGFNNIYEGTKWALNTSEYLRYQYTLWSTTTETGRKFTGVLSDVGAGLSLLKDDLITAVKQPFKWGKYLADGAIDLIPKAISTVGNNIIGGVNNVYQGTKQLIALPGLLKSKYIDWVTNTALGKKFAGGVEVVKGGLNLLKDDLITVAKQPFKWGKYLADGAIDIIPRVAKNVGKNLITSGITFIDDVKHVINVPEYLRYQYKLWTTTTESGKKFSQTLTTTSEFFKRIRSGIETGVERGISSVKDVSKTLIEKVNNVSRYTFDVFNKTKEAAKFKYEQLINVPEYLRYQYKLWTTTTKSGVKFQHAVKNASSYGSKAIDYIFDGLPDTFKEGIEKIKNIDLSTLKPIELIKQGFNKLKGLYNWTSRSVVEVGKKALKFGQPAWELGKRVSTASSKFLTKHIDSLVVKAASRFSDKAVYSLLAKGYKETVIDSLAPAIDLWTFGHGSKKILQLNSSSTRAEVEEAYIEAGAARKGIAWGIFGKFAAGGVGDIIGSLAGQYYGSEEAKEQAQLTYSARDYGVVPYLEKQVQPLLRDTALAMETGKGINKAGSYLITRYLADATLRTTAGQANRLDKVALVLQKGYQSGQQKIVEEASKRFVRVLGKAPKPELVTKLATKSPGFLSKWAGKFFKILGPIIDTARIVTGINKTVTARTESEKRVGMSRTYGGVGSLLGAGVGSFFGPVGTIVGSIAGDAIGSAIGDHLGKKTHETKTDAKKVLTGSAVGGVAGFIAGVASVIGIAAAVFTAPISLTVIGVAAVAGGLFALGGALAGGLLAMNKKPKPQTKKEVSPSPAVMTTSSVGMITFPTLISYWVSGLFNKTDTQKLERKTSETKQYLNVNNQAEATAIRNERLLTAYKENATNSSQAPTWWESGFNNIKTGLIKIKRETVELLNRGANKLKQVSEQVAQSTETFINNVGDYFNNSGGGNLQVSPEGIYWGKAANYKPSDLSGLTNRGKKALAALKNKNVRAYLDAIAIAEVGEKVANSSGGYGFLYGDTTSETFDPNTLTTHPNKFKSRWGRTSSATGRYQAVQNRDAKVWDEEKGRLGLRDFKPQSQELIAVSRLMYRGILDDVMAGNFEGTIRRTGHMDASSEWASLEGNPYGQGTVGGKKKVFLQNIQRSLSSKQASSPVITNGGTDIKVTPESMQTTSTPQTVKMLRTGQLDDKGLEKLALGIYGKDGKLIDSFIVNSGIRSTQRKFGKPGTTQSGSLAPVEYGVYNIGGEVAGVGPGVGKIFIPVNPTFSTDRSAIGFHNDANRASAPGSAGCIVFVSEDEFNRFRASLKQSGAKKFIFEAPNGKNQVNPNVNNSNLVNNPIINQQGRTVTTPNYKVKSLGGREFGERYVNNADDLVPHWRGTGGYTRYRTEDGKEKSYLDNGLRVVDLKLSINGKESVPVPSPVSGKVVQAGFAKDGLGIIAIKDSQGTVHRILHNKTIDVKVGQNVVSGQSLGIQGTTGRTSTTVHVHLETTESVLQTYIKELSTGKFNNSNVVTTNESLEAQNNGQDILNNIVEASKVVGGLGVEAVKAATALLTGGLGILQLLYGPFKSVGVISVEDQSRERGIYASDAPVINNQEVRENKAKEQANKQYSGVTQAVALAANNLNKAKSQIDKAVNNIKPVAVVVNTNNPAAESSVSIMNTDTTRPPVRKPSPQVVTTKGQGNKFDVQLTSNDYYISHWNQITGMGVSSEYCLQDSGLA